MSDSLSTLADRISELRGDGVVSENVSVFGSEYTVTASRQSAGFLSRIRRTRTVIEVMARDEVLGTRRFTRPTRKSTIRRRIVDALVEAHNERDPNDGVRRFAREYVQTVPQEGAKETFSLFGVKYTLIAGGRPSDIDGDSSILDRILSRETATMLPGTFTLIRDGEIISNYATGDLAQTMYLDPFATKFPFFEEDDQLADQLVADVREWMLESHSRHLHRFD